MNLVSIGQHIVATTAQRRRPPRPERAGFPPRRILVVRLKQLGDLICALPLYRTLQANWPEAQIDWLLSSQNAPLAPFLRAQGNIFVLPKIRLRYWLPKQLLRDLQAQRYHLSLAVKGGFDSLLAWVSLAAAAQQRIGFVSKEKRFLDLAYTKPCPPPDSHQHQVEKCLELIDDFRLPKRSDDISLGVPASAREKIRTLLHDWKIDEAKAFAVFQLSSTKRSFCRWPVEYFIELGKKLLAEGVPVCINALPHERRLGEKLREVLGPTAHVASFADMAAYLAFLAATRVVIGSDGGGIHLAAAMGAHTVGFYAESHPMKWRPWQGKHIQFYTANRDVREVTPAQVWQELCAAGWLGSES